MRYRNRTWCWLRVFLEVERDAAAPVRSPASAEPVESLDFLLFQHYADPVGNSVTTTHVAQRLAPAVFDRQL